MNIDQIEAKVKSLDKTSRDFIYDLLRAYGLPKASISRLRSGNLNLSKTDNIIIWKKKLFYQVELHADLHLTIDELVGNPNTQKHNPRFIIVTDCNTILSVDAKTGDSLDVELERLDRHYDFFLPWAGMEKSQLQNENPADIKAAEKMAKLFDEIKKDNLDDSDEFKHKLNVFMARLLFCFFAEDTNIFDEDIFTNSINSYTQEDGSDLDEFLNKLFLLLNQPDSERTDTPSYLKNYPYVGGRLFRHNYKSPKFSKRSRQAIIDSGVIDWSEINPDIFINIETEYNIDSGKTSEYHAMNSPNAKSASPVPTANAPFCFPSRNETNVSIAPYTSKINENDLMMCSIFIADNANNGKIPTDLKYLDFGKNDFMV